MTPPKKQINDNTWAGSDQTEPAFSAEMTRHVRAEACSRYHGLGLEWLSQQRAQFEIHLQK